MLSLHSVFIYFYLISNIIYGVKCGHILLIQCVASESYKNVIDGVINTLAPEHQITLFSMAHKHYEHPNVTLTKLKLPKYIFLQGFENIFEKRMKRDDTDDGITILFRITSDYVKEVLADEPFKKLLKTKTKYDLLITFTSVSEFIFPFANVLNVPLVQVASTITFPWQNEAIGNPNFMSTDDNLYVNEDSDSFYSRLIKYFKCLKLMLNYKYTYIPQFDQGARSFFPPNIPSIETISKNTSLLISNTHYTMNFPRPILPNMIEIGGMHCKEQTEKLPESLREFMDGANESGLIYVSFGATIQNQFPQSLQNSFINVFRKIPQRVIWKVTNDVTGLPKNVKAIKWCPQQAILGHKNTKLFISQGGTISLQESVYNGVPVLVMPISFDQPTNARIAQKNGYGRVLRFTNFSEENFLDEITTMLSNKKYENKAMEISSILKEEQSQNKEKLKWWINFIIRNKGNPLNNYKSNNDYYNWARWIEIDIALFIIFLIVMLILVIKDLLKFIKKKYMKNISYRKNKNI